MASIIYNSALRDEAAGAIDFDTDSFKVMLLSSSYTPASHTPPVGESSGAAKRDGIGEASTRIGEKV